MQQRILLAVVLGLFVCFSGACVKKSVVSVEHQGASMAQSDVSQKKITPDNNVTEPTITSSIKIEPLKEPATGLSTMDRHNKYGESSALTDALTQIFFGYDDSSLSESARETLSKNAVVMRAKEGVNFRIEGHCDERGSSEYNLALGEKRALAAMRYLVSLGIPETHLSIISYGEERPAVIAGNDEESWAKNRRDEFKIIPAN